MIWNFAEKLIIRQAVLTAAIVLCTFLSAFSCSVSDVRAADTLTDRAQKYINSQPNKQLAEKVVKAGFARLNNVLNDISVRQDREESSPVADATNYKVLKLNPAVENFLSQGFHQTTKRDIALAVAFPDWRKRISSVSVQCSYPAGTPTGLLLVGYHGTAGVAPTTNSTLKNLKLLVSQNLLADLQANRNSINSLVRVPCSADIAQRSLPLVI